MPTHRPSPARRPPHARALARPPRAAADVRGFGARPLEQGDGECKVGVSKREVWVATAGVQRANHPFTPASGPAALPPPPSLAGKSVRANWNATSLAFLGDAVWELYARRHHFFPPARTTVYCDAVTAAVRAEAQAAALETLLAGPLLTDEERDVVRWGRNARVSVPRRFAGAGPHAATYRAATAAEALVGWLYLTQPSRLAAVMEYVGLGGPPDVAEALATARRSDDGGSEESDG